MERGQNRDGRRRPDTREHKVKEDRDRSRSPPNRERRDDRRRERSPYRGSSRGGPAHRGGGRDRDYVRSRDGPTPNFDNKREPTDRHNRPNGAGQRGFKQQPINIPDVKMEGLEGEDEETTMKRIMGFANFKTTKDTKVPGNDKNYGVNKVKKAEYRQYMNRVGGFNRPLSPSRM